MSTTVHNSHLSTMSSVPKPPKALVFDLMGTCTNWHSSILLSLQGQPSTPLVPAEDLSSLAAQWRAGFFAEIHRKFEAQEAAEDIDVTHRRVLDRLLQERGVGLDVWGEDVRKKLVASWHSQSGLARVLYLVYEALIVIFNLQIWCI